MQRNRMTNPLLFRVLKYLLGSIGFSPYKKFVSHWLSGFDFVAPFLLTLLPAIYYLGALAPFAMTFTFYGANRNAATTKNKYTC